MSAQSNCSGSAGVMHEAMQCCAALHITISSIIVFWLVHDRPSALLLIIIIGIIITTIILSSVEHLGLSLWMAYVSISPTAADISVFGTG